MRQFSLVRMVHSSNHGIMGMLGEIVNGEFEFISYTLELPDRNNRHGVSCIPVGVYELTTKRMASGFFKGTQLPLVQGVSNRDGIFIHPASKTSELEGCIGVSPRLDESKGLFHLLWEPNFASHINSVLKGGTLTISNDSQKRSVS